MIPAHESLRVYVTQARATQRRRTDSSEVIIGRMLLSRT